MWRDGLKQYEFCTTNSAFITRNCRAYVEQYGGDDPNDSIIADLINPTCPLTPAPGQDLETEIIAEIERIVQEADSNSNGFIDIQEGLNIFVCLWGNTFIDQIAFDLYKDFLPNPTVQKALFAYSTLLKPPLIECDEALLQSLEETSCN